MLTTILLALLAGFSGGNGLPYFVAGSTGDGRNPAPFGDSAVTNVLIGCGMFLVAAVCWHFAHTAAHPLAGYAAGAVGVLAVGLIHARTWRHNPWPWRRTS
ncbi:hypothetical protein GCM10023191_096670 [Actinoallomurus oryzae]|uniref:DUF998 domain-containing protein n=1 Tax=Actinoallomurus oryzae TaxID=502180 RepID=A0ABP8R7Q0_9ACTN